MSSLIFTSDFHQLIRGDFNNDLRCNISYDPRRFWQQFKNYVFGQPEIIINVCGIFHPSNTVFQTPLLSKVGILANQVLEMDGTGSMLAAELEFPSDITELELWFTLTDINGATYFDSNEGRNYKFRFTAKDVISKKVIVANNASLTHAGIQVDITTMPFVESVNFRYSITNSPGRYDEKIIALIPDKDINTGNINWKSKGESIPLDAVIAYDYNYYINGVKYKDDNEGKYFVEQATSDK
jgi:flagellar hook assembly protein FlgD